MQENKDSYEFPQSSEDYYGTSKEISRLIADKSRRRYTAKNIIGFLIFIVMFLALLPSAAIGLLSIPAQIAYRQEFVENRDYYIHNWGDVYLRVYEFYQRRFK